jgi:hypothetical protein
MSTAAEAMTAAALTLVSNAAAMLMAAQSAADGGRMAMTVLRQLPCSKK